MKKLYRSRVNKVWAGVLGGFGEYYNVDPTLLRVLFVLVLFVTGIIPGLLAYIVSTFIIPVHPDPNQPKKVKAKEVK